MKTRGEALPASWALQDALALLFALLLAAAVLSQGNPLLTLPNTDGGFFLYAGRLILQGKLPYVDFWDSKGPGIYYINALGLALGHGLRWGVWLVEFAFLTAGFYLLWRVMSRQWGTAPAAFGLSVGAAGLARVLNGGNLTEEYALLFNAAALYVFWRDITAPAGRAFHPGRPALIGLLAGLSFSFRANNVGIPAAILLATLLDDIGHRRLRTAAARLALMAAGFAAPVLAGVWYFGQRGALAEFIEAAFLYNFRYAGSRARSLSGLLRGFSEDKLGWTAWLGLAGSLVAAAALARKAVLRRPLGSFDILLAALLWIEVVLSGLSWRQFDHYFISWVPAVAVFSAYLLAQALRLWPGRGAAGPPVGAGGPWMWALIIPALLLVSRGEVQGYARTAAQMLYRRGEGVEYRDYLSEYVEAHTGPGEGVLTWPGDPWINFASRRESPVRLLFYPVFDAGTITAQQGKGYLDDLAAHEPALILDCSDVRNETPSLDPAVRKMQYARGGFLFSPPYLDDVFAYVAAHYHVEQKMPKCTIYRRNG